MPTITLEDEIINQNIETVNTILRYGVDVNQIDKYGFTPLIETTIANNIDMARLLLEHGADVNLQDMTGGTALHWAAENNNELLCQLLLEHGANPNAYNLAGQPVLTMPLLRQHTSLKKLLQRAGANLVFTQDYINTKMLGHIYELVGVADIVDTKQHFVEVDFEGFILEFSIGMIRDSVAQFQNHYAARKVRHYGEISNIILNAFDRASRLIKFQQYQINRAEHQDEISMLLKAEPALIPVGYEGHAITFVKLGNIFAKCDRREDSRLYDNIMFYQVTNPAAFTQDLLKTLVYERNTSEFINEDLHRILGLQPITELKVEAQISGNCSWANVEAAIPTIFFLLLLASTLEQSHLVRYKSMALDYFKQWRDWNKARALQFCLQRFENRDIMRNACRAEILAAILFQRLRHENLADRPKIEAILSILTRPVYVHVLENYIKTYIYEGRSEEGQAFAKMLKAYGIL